MRMINYHFVQVPIRGISSISIRGIRLPVSICKKKVLKSCHVNSELEIFTMRTKILQCLSPIFGLFRYSLANDKKKNSILVLYPGLMGFR